MIYFDNSATTKPSDAALEAALLAARESWANPSSTHFAGNDARRMLERARDSVSRSLGLRRASDGKLIFTSGGTEANSLAILGTVGAKERKMKNGSRGTVVITDSEHPSVAECASFLEKEGFRILRIPTRGGVCDTDFLKRNITSDVILASVMLVNNETGAVYDVKEISRIVKESSPDAVFHTDIVQGYLKSDVFSPFDLGADMASVSAHKVNALKGAGALYVSSSIIKAKKLVPTVHGGGQEDGFRSGTEAAPALAAFGAAADDGQKSLAERQKKLLSLSEYAVSRLSATDGVRLNLPPKRAPHILSVTVFNIKSETMLNYLSSRGICVSKSSACSSRSRNLSATLLNFGLSEREVDCTLRLSFSFENTTDEIDLFISSLKEGISKLAPSKRP